jgi:hypothetical protein
MMKMGAHQKYVPVFLPFCLNNYSLIFSLKRTYNLAILKRMKIFFFNMVTDNDWHHTDIKK